MDAIATQHPVFQAQNSQRFLDEWLRLRRADSELTSWEALSEDLSSDLIMNMVVDEHVEPEPIIRFMGSELVHMWGYDVTGLPAPPIGGREYANIRDHLNALMLKQPCGCMEYVRSVTAGHKRILTEAVFLPLETGRDRPCRFAIHISMLERPRYDFDNPAKIGVPHDMQWIDLGFGVPND